MRSPGIVADLRTSYATVCLLFLAILCIGISCTAQETTPYTLHVYTNLVQLPTLVLSHSLEFFPPLKREQFNLSVDSGPTFHPTQIHLEGADPITLAILLDVSGGVTDLMPGIDTAIASLYPHSLAPHDSIAIFAFDCGAAGNTLPIHSNAERLKLDVEKMLTVPSVHGPNHATPTCYRTSRLWDTLAGIVHGLSTLPGRRAVVVISSGFDHESKIPWPDVQRFASTNSIAVFGIQSETESRLPSGIAGRNASENNFRLLCNGTGGLVLPISSKKLPTTLQHIIELLRSRYILEFPRPSNSTAGLHIVDVHVPGKDVVIRSAGVTVPLPSEIETSDPNTIPPDPTRTPTQGKRKPITH